MIIGGFTPFTLTDYPGEIAAIVFTQGCNFSCPFCHNRRLIPFEPETASTDPVHGGMEQVLNFLNRRRHRIGAIVISGGEPTLQPGLLYIMAEIRRLDYKIKLDTNGSRPEVVKAILEQGLADMIAMDIKAPWRKYHVLAGKTVGIASVKKTMQLILQSGIRHIFRTTFVPGLLARKDIQEIREILPPNAEYVVQEYREYSHIKVPDAAPSGNKPPV